jgi:hypothetical protein
MARIEVIKAGIERTKVRIEELDRTLKQNGVKIAGLERCWYRLQERRQQGSRDRPLTFTVDTLETRNFALTNDVEFKRVSIGTIYYAMGSPKALKESGIIVAQWRVLGVGKTIEPSKQLNEYAFVAMDTDQQTVITIPDQETRVPECPARIELRARVRTGENRWSSESSIPRSSAR